MGHVCAVDEIDKNLEGKYLKKMMKSENCFIFDDKADLYEILPEDIVCKLPPPMIELSKSKRKMSQLRFPVYYCQFYLG